MGTCEGVREVMKTSKEVELTSYIVSEHIASTIIHFIRYLVKYELAK